MCNPLFPVARLWLDMWKKWQGLPGRRQLWLSHPASTCCRRCTMLRSLVALVALVALAAGRLPKPEISG